MRAIRTEDLEDLVAELDAKVVEGRLAWKTACNVWGVTQKLFKDACRAKRRELRVLGRDVCAGVLGPDRGDRPSLQYLHPDEFSALVGCADVPLRWARLYCLAVYTYLRVGELEALEWGDVDLVHGILHVHQAVERRSRATNGTKTGRARRVTIEPALMPLLERLFKESKARRAKGDQRVVQLPPRSDLAKTLRMHLDRAGVRRRELHEMSATSKQIRFHDLRATGITWLAVRGDDPLKIRARAGHATFSTTEKYIRLAEVVREGFGDVFPALDGAGKKVEDMEARGQRLRGGRRRCSGLPGGTGRGSETFRCSSATPSGPSYTNLKNVRKSRPKRPGSSTWYANKK